MTARRLLAGGLAAALLGAATTAPAAPRAAVRTVVTAPGDLTPAADGTLRLLVALPPGASGCRADVVAGPAGATVVGTRTLGVLRGVPVAAVAVRGAEAGTALELAVEAEAATAPAAAGPRLRDPAFDAAVGDAVSGWPAARSAPSGSFVVVTAPAYADAAALLADWKRRQGVATSVVTTNVTGTTAAAIRDWLRDAYESWPRPPAYVLLLGDTGDVPAWEFSANVTDLPYALLDGDDWLPDLMLGRLPADSPAAAANLVAKTVAYERTPYRAAGDAWFGRALAVGGNYGSDTPVTTVTWCGQQLETIGFAPATRVTFPPYWNGVAPITAALEQGVSMVVYRGWAYGTSGWEPPHFTVAEIPAVDNGAMTPVVMSFVCLNGDFAGAQPCFGEVLLSQGSAGAPQGAVAFIGNGEHWSHTRFNDAMAISFFERIVDPAVTDLGQLMVAGKLRFIRYFPLELEFEDWGEESVEFYCHIYNLLGDPGLRFVKGVPREIALTPPAELPVGADYLEVAVAAAEDGAPLPGARVGVYQAGALLGAALAGADGLARVALDAPVAADAPVALTATADGRFAREAALGPAAASYVTAGVAGLDDGATPPAAGNGDGLPNPGETIALTAALANAGAGPVTGVTATLACQGPAVAGADPVAFPDVPAGGSAEGAAPFLVAVAPSAEDGATILGIVRATHLGGVSVSQVSLTVAAPRLVATAVTVDGDGFADPGEDATLTFLLRNDGHAPTTGGTLLAQLVPADAGELLDSDGVFGPLAPGQSGPAGPIVLRLRPDLAVGAGLTLRLALATAEGAAQTTACAAVAGNVDCGAPVGPDAHGYRAYDSADIDHPAAVPAYRWTELSPAYGGAGTEVPFAVDNQVRLVDLPFPFVYYGRAFTRVRVSDNGWISFDTDGALDFYNWPLPSPHGNHSVVAPFWDNFDPTLAESDGVYWAHDAAAGTFTVEWSRMRHYQPEIDDLQTFQVVLRDPAVHPTPTGDGEILFLYRQVANTDYLRTYATVGIEDPTETDGLPLSYANVYAPGAAPLSPGLAVLLTTREAPRVPFGLSAFAARAEAGGVRLTWQPVDDRPVTGWLVERWADGRAVPVAGPLPAGARECLDAGASPGPGASWRLTALHPYGRRTALGPYAGEGGTTAPADWSLACSPNPAPGAAAVAFAVPRAGPVRLRVFDAAGRRVRTLWEGEASAGSGRLLWDGRDDAGRVAADGVYFCRLEAGGRTFTRKLLLVR